MTNKELEDVVASLFFAVSHLRESMDSHLNGKILDKELSRLHLRDCERCLNEIIQGGKLLEKQSFEEDKRPI